MRKINKNQIFNIQSRKNVGDFLLKFVDLSGAKVGKSSRSRQEPSNEYLLAKHLQKSASIQPRTSLSKFGGKFKALFIRLLRCHPLR